MRESTITRATTPTAPPISEADLQRIVTDALTLCGFHWLHIRAGRTAGGWAVPVRGPLGVGFCDVLAVRPRDQRIVAIELKQQRASPTADQLAVMAVLAAAGIEVYVIRPSDIDHILEVLR
jgi:hypothetical protein